MAGVKNTEVSRFINARLFDPAGNLDEVGAVTVERGVITALGNDRAAPDDGTEVIDCAGQLLVPGLIDMCAATGEPGNEHRETLASASQAAAAGGVTTMIMMPDTDPPIDDVALVDFLNLRARETASVHIEVMAALTKRLEGREMTEIGLLRAAGAVAFTDGRHSVSNARVMQRAMAYAGDLGALIVHNPQDTDLADGGVMNRGEVSTRLGLPGIPAAAEIIQLERDLRLVEMTGARYHAQQLSCAEAVNIMRRAKKNGLPVSCGVSSAHLVLNENDIGAYRTFLKLTPPLRGEADRRALVEGVADGTIDVIVSAHDPQDTDTKRRPFAEAASGAIGLETLLPACLMLYHQGEVPLDRIIDALTAAPARLLGLDCGRLLPGAPGDFTLVDLEAPWLLDIVRLRSKSKNTPFEGSRFQGRAVRTVVGGRTVYQFTPPG